MTYNKGTIYNNETAALKDYIIEPNKKNTDYLEKFMYDHATSAGKPDKGGTVRNATDFNDLKNGTNCNTMKNGCHDQSLLDNQVTRVMGKDYVDKLKEDSKNNNKKGKK